MEKYLWLALVLIIVILVILLLERLRRKTTETLDKILYIDENPKLYLELLNNKRLKWIFTSQTILHFRLNAYLMLDDKKKINESFDLLTSSPMSKGEKLEFNSKKLSYYCLNYNDQKAKEALDDLHKLLDKNKNSKMIELKNESDLIYDIYIKHDISLINDLIEKSKIEVGQVKGITLFRCAKLYYYAKNIDKAKEFLLQSKPYLVETDYEEKVNGCLKDISLLKKY